MSIVVPLYNGERTIRQTLQGLLSQSRPDFEIVVVDDASFDRGCAIVEEMARADPRIMLVRLPENGRAAHARNVGFARSRGKYIVFHDHDDVSRPDRLRKQVAALDLEPQVDVVISDWEVVETDGFRHTWVLPSIGPTDQDSLRRVLACELAAPPGAWMIRRDAVARLGGFDEQLPGWTDCEFLARIASRCRIRTMAETLFEYHCQPGGTYDDGEARLRVMEGLRERYRSQLASWPDAAEVLDRGLLIARARAGDRLGAVRAFARLLRQGIAQPLDALRVLIGFAGPRAYAALARRHARWQLMGRGRVGGAIP